MAERRYLVQKSLEKIAREKSVNDYPIRYECVQSVNNKSREESIKIGVIRSNVEEKFDENENIVKVTEKSATVTICEDEHVCNETETHKSSHVEIEATQNEVKQKCPEKLTHEDTKKIVPIGESEHVCDETETQSSHVGTKATEDEFEQNKKITDYKITHELSAIRIERNEISQLQKPTEAKSFTHYCILGTSVINQDNLLHCDEELSTDECVENRSDNSLYGEDKENDQTDIETVDNICNGDNENIPETDDMDTEDELEAFYDLDDSVNDPTWKPETTKRNKRRMPISSSSSSSDDTCIETFCDKPKAKRLKGKIKKKQSKTFMTYVQSGRSMNLEGNFTNNSENPTETKHSDTTEEHSLMTSDNTTVNSESENTLSKACNSTEGSGSIVENGDVDHEEVVTTESAQTDSQTQKKSKARKGMGNPAEWTKNVQKRLRMEGKSYKGLKNIDGQKSYSAERSERILADRNCGKRCRNSRRCFDVSEDTRKEIFDAFWNNMNWNAKKMYVAGLVDKCEVTQRTSNSRSEARDPRKKYTYKYYLRSGENKINVCKGLFLSTIGIGEYMLYDWLKSVDDKGIPITTESQGTSNGNRTQNGTTEALQNAKHFFEKLPKLPSHYCRATTSKLYLEPVFTSFANVYRFYEEECMSTGKPTVSRQCLKKQFDEMNLGIFQPRKDQCDVCVGYVTKNVTEEDYEKHIKRKNEARAEKAKDKERAIMNSNKVKVITMDVQSVLLCPSIEASSTYFKTKLACHNYTIYDLNTKNVTCYFWHEGEGSLEANSFASCLYDYIMVMIANNPEVEEITLYSDGCGYQNRNVTLSNTLLHIATKYKIQISHNYLEKGHTQMEVDSVHSVIERSIRKQSIYSPANYVQRIEEARNAHPYEVKYIDHTFFRNFNSVKVLDSIRPGYKVGDPVVADVRGFRYNPSGDIEYRLEYDAYQALPQRKRQIQVPVDLPSLYSKPLDIKRTKYEHLQQLKSVIPRDYHAFYDALSYGK